MYTDERLGAVPIAAAVTLATKLGVDFKSPAQHIRERLARAAPLKEAALAGDNAAWAQLWVASWRPLPIRSVDAVQPIPNNPGGWPRVRLEIEQMLREIEGVRGRPTPGNTTQGQSSSALPSLVAKGGKLMLGNLGSMPVIATLGFLALSFLLKDRR